MINLILNAIHAMKDIKSRKISINVSKEEIEEASLDVGARTARKFRLGDTVIHIDLKDNGTGISNEDIEKVFDPFFTTKSTGVGTGLGLSVVRKIVELHGGEISIRNRILKKGAHVRITLVAPRSL